MTLGKLLLGGGWVLGLSAAAAADRWPGRWAAEFDAAVGSWIDQGKVPGVVLSIAHDGERYERAYGWRAVVPAVEEMTEDTLFDVASLTKVVATTPAVMRLVEEGSIDLDEPVTRYLEEFTGDGREAIPVKWLLTHTSGMAPGIKFRSDVPWSGYDEGIARACRQELDSKPGTKFVYSDINFILLGEIVRRVSGRWVDEYAREHFFRPLGMVDTGFRPAAVLRSRVAPTTIEADGKPVRGVVHDPTSRRMGGVCGHAGLFSTGRDLGRFCQMLLNGGVLDGRRVLSETTVARMTAVHSPEKLSAKRGLGWDVDSRFSSQRGEFFSAGSFGHTGWTGTSLWIDPASRTSVVFLSNRNHPSESGAVSSLRGRLGTLAAESVADWRTVVLPGLLVPWPAPREVPVLDRVRAPVLTGIDVLARDRFSLLAGRRVGLITNHTGIDRQRVATIDLLRSAPGMTLVALFSPEHGIRGALDQSTISDTTDEKSGLPVFSLYGERRAPTPGQLAGLDTLVFDIQDIGCRFYTYVSTMALAMEVAAREGKRFVVLDRPNPIGGDVVAGPLRDGPDSFTAAHAIPLRHGMTAGELARMIAAERKWTLDLHVVKCTGWKRPQLFDETGLPWINPSPNMRTLSAALLYPGIGMLEFTNLSVGRGTDTPFEIIGAPWIDEAALAAELGAAGIPGVSVMSVQFTPASSVYKDALCRGVRLSLTDRHTADALSLGAAIASALCRRHPDKFETRNLNRLLAHEPTAAAIKAGHRWTAIRPLWLGDTRAFRLRRRPFLMY